MARKTTLSKRVIREATPLRMGTILVTLASIAAGGIWLAITLGASSYFAGNEFLVMAQAKGFRPSVRIVRAMIIAFFAMAVPTFHLSSLLELWSRTLSNVAADRNLRKLLSPALPPWNPPATIADVATTILGFIYVGFLPSHLVLLRNLVPPNELRPENSLLQPGLAYVIAGLFSILATDVFAYVFGKKFGKTPLYPQVSPKNRGRSDWRICCFGILVDSCGGFLRKLRARASL